VNVPGGWDRKMLSEVVKEKISYGIVQAGPHITDGVPYIKSSDVRGKIDPEKLQKTSKDIHFKYRRSSVHPGDIVFSLRGNIGELAIVPDDLPEANLTQGTARISVSKDHNSYFHHYQLQTFPIISRINALSKGSTFKEISLEELRKIQVLCPPITEQRKIAKILSTWDEAIATTEHFLANSEQQKKALMQQLLIGKKRLPGFEGEWQSEKLGDLFKERKESGLSDYPLLSVTQDQGIIYRDDVGRKDTSSEDKSKYLKVCPGDIAYNTMRMWQGVSALSGLEGIVSPAYTVLKPSKLVDSRFAAYLFKLPPIIHLFFRHSQGLVSDTWNLKYNHFAKITVVVPRLEEQKAIATVISEQDKVIQALKKELVYFKSEKKALMQQLLTGKRRVKNEEEAEAITA